MNRASFWALLAGTTAVLSMEATAQPPGFPNKAIQGFAKSMEQFIRSEAQTNMRPSMAAVDRQTALSMSYDNQIKHTQTYFEKRKLNRMYRDAERGPRPTRQDMARYASYSRPDSLNVKQYDSFTGRINWPVVLKAETYRKERTKLDDLFARHAANGGGINSPEYAEIQSAINVMDGMLRKNLKTMPSEQYMYASKFLKSLKYQARS